MSNMQRKKIALFFFRLKNESKKVTVRKIGKGDWQSHAHQLAPAQTRGATDTLHSYGSCNTQRNSPHAQLNVLSFRCNFSHFIAPHRQDGSTKYKWRSDSVRRLVRRHMKGWIGGWVVNARKAFTSSFKRTALKCMQVLCKQIVGWYSCSTRRSMFIDGI